ncbi:hypothetical protein [Telluribacter sp.]|jgi:hypothetical protein|uniref:hypothetical protein n=1 Tax=Telluribacter sp. TaxID=1978767 RepID=UPI002E10B0F1|nr:hypothetical protein [Telluribacter sp.]
MAKTRALDKLKEKTADLKPAVFTHELAIKSNLIILPELRSLIPPLRAEESQQLESNLLTNGIKDPLTIWETTPEVVLNGLAPKSASRELVGDADSSGKIYVLIDGHNRYDLAQRHGLDYRINILDFEDMNQVRDYMINYQLGRRNLTPEQASYLRGLRYNKMKEENRSDRINVAQQLADEYQVSTRTIKRDSDYAKGVEELSPELKKEVLTGKAKLPRAAAKVLSKEKPGRPIESQEELDKVLERLPKAFKSLNDLKANPEDEETGKSKEIEALIKGVAKQDKPQAGTSKGSEPAPREPVAEKLQRDLKSLIEKDLTQKEVLQEIIDKATALMESIK